MNLRHLKWLALAGVLAIAAGVSAPVAGADPTNAKGLVFTFQCPGFQFSAVAIAQNDTYTGHVVDPDINANFVVAQVSIGGEVVPMRKVGLPGGIPGALKRGDLVSCQVIAVGGEDISGDQVVFTGRFTGGPS
jgi:hypothetical protein